MSADATVEAWEGSPCALLSLLPDGTVVAANRSFLEWVGRDPGDVVGRMRLSELLSVGGRIYWETHLSLMLVVDRRVDEVAVELKGTHGRVPVLLTAEVAKSDVHGGDVVRVAMTSARERSRYERELVAARAWAESSEARVRLLQGTTAALSQAFGVAAVADAVLAAARGPLGAAAATVWLPGAGSGLVIHASEGDAPGVAELPAYGELLHRQVAVEHDGRIVVPLQGHTDLQGVLSVIASNDAGADALDMEALTAVGQQAGLALDRAVLYEQSASVAHELQQSLLAVEPPADNRFDVAATYRPGVELLDVGGDWYDVFGGGGGLLSVVVGDVVGRGLGAASAMGQLRSAVRAVVCSDTGPAQLLTRLDRFVEQVEAASMATLVYAELDLAVGSVRYASAGHPPPLLLPLDAEPRLLWGGRSMPLGAFVDAEDRPEADVQLQPGDRLLLYTDGLIERREREIDQGLDLLVAAARRTSDLPLEEAVRLVTEALLHDERVRDDVCVLMLRWHGGG